MHQPQHYHQAAPLAGAIRTALPVQGFFLVLSRSSVIARHSWRP
jgi:hypothetical protein